MTEATDDEIRAEIGERTDASADGWEFGAIADQYETLVADVEAIRSCPLLPTGMPVSGMIYDVDTGVLTETVAP